MRFSDRYNLIADCNLGAIEKAVLYAINRFDGKNEAIFPSVKVLAVKAGLSERSVQQQLKSLETRGILSINRGYRANGSPSVSEYRINFDFLVSARVPNEVHLVNVVHQGGERGAPGVVNVVHQGGERGAPPYIIDQQPILTANIEQPILTPPKGSQKNILPDEGPDFRDMLIPSQAPLSEKAGTSNALLKTSPKNSPADSEKNGFEEGFSSFSSLQGQAEPGGLTPLPPASRSNCSETHDKAFKDVDPYKDTENESGWRNAHQDEKERHTGQLLQLIKTPPEEKREPKLATDFEKRGLKVPLESIATMEVWREHRKYHVKSHETPGKGIFDIVKSAYRQLSGDHDDRVADLVLLVEAANCCPYKPFSYDIRGQGWEDRGGFDRSGDLDTIFRHKKMPARLQSAKEWEEAGKPEEISAPNRRVGHEKFNLEGKFDSDPKWSKPIPGMEGVTMPGFDDEEFWAKYGPILGTT